MDIKMDIKEKISELLEKITGDKDLLTKFKSDPLGTVKALVGDKFSSDQLSAIVEGIKAKINLDSASGLLGKAEDAIGGLFGKK